MYLRNIRGGSRSDINGLIFSIAALSWGLAVCVLSGSSTGIRLGLCCLGLKLCEGRCFLLFLTVSSDATEVHFDILCDLLVPFLLLFSELLWFNLFLHLFAFCCRL
jgi:hypothetical protein